MTCTCKYSNDTSKKILINFVPLCFNLLVFLGTYPHCLLQDSFSLSELYSKPFRTLTEPLVLSLSNKLAGWVSKYLLRNSLHVVEILFCGHCTWPHGLHYLQLHRYLLCLIDKVCQREGLLFYTLSTSFSCFLLHCVCGLVCQLVSLYSDFKYEVDFGKCDSTFLYVHNFC